jgi:putative DNA primase/helicase
VFLDLGDDEWRVVEVTANGWAVRAESPVPFLRHNATLPLPEPARDGSLEELRDFLNLPDERSWRLVVTFLVMLLQPSGPFPILVVQGEQGSGKTTTARAVRLLIDPVKAMLRAGSPSERDLMISASRQWLLGFDNVSKLTDRLSDALCQLSTGAGFATRQLDTDADEVVMEATRGLLLNGIAGIADRPDFASRALVIVLPQIPAGRRRSEGESWETFEQARPGILGALLDTLAGVLKVLPSIELQAAPRLADFAKVGTAVERVLGWPDGSFLKALEDTQAGAMSDALDAEPVAAPIIAFASKRKEWSGTPTQLYTALAAAAGEDQTRRREWPGNPSQLGMRLRRIAPSLRNAGVEFDDGSSGRDRDKQRHYTLTWTPSDGDDDDGDNGDASA